MKTLMGKWTREFGRRLCLSAAVIAIGSGAAFGQPGPGDHRPGDRGGPPAGDNQGRRGPGRDGQRGEFRDRFPGRGGDRPELREVPKEMVDIVMNILQERAPRLHQRLSAIRERSPQRFQFVLRKVMPPMHEYLALRERKPEIAGMILQELEAEDQLRDLGRQYAAAKDDAAKQATLGQEIETLVRKQIEIRQKRMTDRFEDFANRIKEQQEQLERWKQRAADMNSHTEELVARRVEQIKSGKMPEGPGPGMRPRPGGGPDDRPPGMGPDGDGPPFGRPPHGPPPDDFSSPSGDRPPPPPPPEDEPPPDEQE